MLPSYAGPFVLLLSAAAGSREISIADFGAVAANSTVAMGLQNMAAVNAALTNATDGDVVVVPPGDWHALGGIQLRNAPGITLRVDGALRAIADFDAWPLRDPANYAHFLHLTDCARFTLRGNGTIDGTGKAWWNKWVLDPLPAHRPCLVVLSRCDDLLVEGVELRNSPNFHLDLEDTHRAEVRFVSIFVNRTDVAAAKAVLTAQRRAARSRGSGGGHGGHNALLPSSGSGGFPLQPEDLNTDGIDVSGVDVWVHDVVIDNDDDSIAVKPCGSGCRLPCSQNMLFEDMVLHGFGASVGSVPPHPGVPNCVRNITFRRVRMPETGKGIYVKSNPSCETDPSKPYKSGIIADILYEDIHITSPRWWAIWIGPQQQHEPKQSLGEDCAIDYPISKSCPTQGCVTFANITLRDVVVDGTPLLSPGVVLGNATNPMRNIVFDNVTVNKPGEFPFLGGYKCENVIGTVSGSHPTPKCIVPPQ